VLVKDQPENLPSTNALDKFGEQGALIEAAFVRFSGGSGAALESPPAKGEQRTYIVKATCIKHIDEVRKDNEDRLTVVMDIDSLWEKGKQPDVDQNQGSLFGDDETTDDEDGEE
jgi:hypothetical protein